MFLQYAKSEPTYRGFGPLETGVWPLRPEKEDYSTVNGNVIRSQLHSTNYLTPSPQHEVNFAEHETPTIVFRRGLVAEYPFTNLSFILSNEI